MGPTSKERGGKRVREGRGGREGSGEEGGKEVERGRGWEGRREKRGMDRKGRGLAPNFFYLA